MSGEFLFVFSCFFLSSFLNAVACQIPVLNATPLALPISIPDNSSFGQDLVNIGDIDQNGFDDFVIGAPTTNSSRGAIYLLRMGSNGALNLNEIQLDFIPEVDDLFGWSVTLVEDINGDSIPDLVVGSPGYTLLSMTMTVVRNANGAVRVLFMNSDFLSVLSSVLITTNQNGGGPNQYGFLGQSILSLGDLSQNGSLVIAVGATLYNTVPSPIGTGGVFLYWLNSLGTIDQLITLSNGVNGAPSLNPGDAFGGGLAQINSSTILTSAPLDDTGCFDSILLSDCNIGALYILNLLPSGIVSSSTKLTTLLNSLNIPISSFFGVDLAYFPSFLTLNGTRPAFFAGTPGRTIGNLQAGGFIILIFQEETNSYEQFEYTIGMSGIPVDLVNSGSLFGVSISPTSATSIMISAPRENQIFVLDFTICGDGLLSPLAEECDDGNRESFDGCNSDCRIESNDLNNSETAIVAIVVSVVAAIFLAIVIALIILILYLVRKKEETLNIDMLKLGDVPILIDITIEGVIGSGNFGEVYRGKWNDNQVALKNIRAQDLDEISNELNLLLQLRHPNIISLFGLFVKDNTELYIVTEFMDRGDLRSLMQRDAELNTPDLLFFSQQSAIGMTHLHSTNIIHRDLACRNILVSKNAENWSIKIADFGMSRKTEEYYTTENKQIPIRWTAPESIEFLTFSPASDVWSFGIVLWEIFSRGAIPYAGLQNRDVLQQVKAGLRLKAPWGMPQDVAKIMEKCCQAIPKDRPSFKEIYNILRNVKTVLERPQTEQANALPQLNVNARENAYQTCDVSSVPEVTEDAYNTGHDKNQE